MEDDEDEDEELDAGERIREEASLVGGEGVRARTSTPFRSFNADDAVAEEEHAVVFIAISAPELGDSERLVIPTARDAAVPVLGGDGDLERGTDSTTFKVEDIDADVDAADKDADAHTVSGKGDSEDIPCCE